MAYKVSDLYGKIIYSGDSDYDCKLFINGDRIPVEQISSIKISSPIIDTTEETGTIFHIGTFISQSITIKFRNLDGLDLTSNPSIYLEIGLKVGEEYEYVPIGEYIIDDLGENYQTSCEITCLDYAVKFKTNVDITQFFDENGEITAAQLFEALCNYYGVGIGTYPTINNNKKIRFYDNTLSGKTYISYLAELFGGNAKMGRDGKLYIISLKPTEVKEYEGETIYIEKSMPVNAPFKLNGNAEQETRSGSNILNFNVTQDSRVTVNDDGTVTISGTGGFGLKFEGITLKSGTTYYQKVELVSGTISGVAINNAFMGFNSSNWITPDSFLSYTPSEDVSKSSIWVNASATFENAVIKMWANTDQSDFEQYGASPSPDYPSEIVTVGQNINELDGVFNKGYSLDNSGAFVTNSKRVSTLNYHKVKSSTIYSIKNYDIEDKTNKYFILCEYRDNNGTLVKRSIIQGNFTTQSTTKYIKFTYYDSNNIDVSNANKFTLYIGDINIEKFIDYGQGSVEIEVCNKNLLNLESLVTKTLNGITLTKNDDGSYMLNGTTTASTGINIPINLSLKKGQAYTHSIHNSYKKGLYISLNNINITMIGNNYNNFKTFTLNEDKTYTNYLIWIDSGTTFNNYIVYPMVENGSTATDYIPHESYTKVLPIQQEMLEDDYIDDVEYHTWGKVVLTGNEGWTLQPNAAIFSTTNILSNAKLPQNNSTPAEMYCNYFKADSYNNVWTNHTTDNIIGLNIDGTSNPRIYASQFTTTEQFKTWLQEKYNSGNPVVVYYKLATPKSLPLTEEQKEVMNGGIQLYEDITNITIDNNLAILNVKATIKKEAIEINALTSKKFEVGDTYEITRVCYDNGITKFQAGGNVISVEELPTEEIYSNSYYYLTKDMKYYKYKEETQEWEIDPTIKNTLYIRQDNMFITTQEEIDNIYNLLKGFKIQNINCENRSDLSLDCWDMIKYTTDKGEYYTLNDNEITFSGVSMGKVITNIPTGTKAETTNIIEGSSEQKIRKVQTQINEVEGTLKIVAEETTQIKGQTDENTTNINNNYNEILQKLEGYATEDDIITVNNKVETMQSSTDFAINIIEDIQANGVSKVKTTTGYTFDENGLEVSKTGAETKSVLNEKGLNVKDNTGSSEESLLFAGYDEKIGETIVKSKNMTVQKYLVIGKYSRVEDYHEGTGVFWIGGN